MAELKWDWGNEAQVQEFNALVQELPAIRDDMALYVSEDDAQRLVRLIDLLMAQNEQLYKIVEDVFVDHSPITLGEIAHVQELIRQHPNWSI